MRHLLFVGSLEKLVCVTMSVTESIRWMIAQHGKNFNVSVFSDTMKVIYVTLCMIVLLVELYPFVPLSVTLSIYCQRYIVSHSSV